MNTKIAKTYSLITSDNNLTHFESIRFPLIKYLFGKVRLQPESVTPIQNYFQIIKVRKSTSVYLTNHHS